jgi:hypothetical protein
MGCLIALYAHDLVDAYLLSPSDYDAVFASTIRTKETNDLIRNRRERYSLLKRATV